MTNNKVLIILFISFIFWLFIPDSIWKELWYKIWYYIKTWERIEIEHTEFYIIK